MKVKLKQACSFGEMVGGVAVDFKIGVHELDDSLADHPYFKLLLKDGKIELLDSEPHASEPDASAPPSGEGSASSNDAEPSLESQEEPGEKPVHHEKAEHPKHSARPAPGKTIHKHKAK